MTVTAEHRILRLRPVATVAAVVVIATITGAPAARTAEPMGARMGFAMGTDWLSSTAAEMSSDVDRIADSGAHWIRIGINWSNVESIQGRPRWAPQDQAISLARRRGLDVIVTLAYTPAWARPAGCTSQFCPPASPAVFGAFAAAAARRYTAMGVRTWEIWNEPNISGYWRPAPDPAGYGNILRAAGAAITANDAGATILVGGLASPPHDTNQSLKAATFLSRLYDAGVHTFTAVAVHPYSYPGPPGKRTAGNGLVHLADVRAVLVAHGDSAKQVWVTEYGYATGTWVDETGAHATSERDQATFLQAAYAMGLSQKWVAVFLWYSWRDRSDNVLDREDNFGVVRADGSAKPALDTFQDVAGAPR